MSLEATVWAFERTGLEPTEKLLLIYLADFHTPDQGCNVSVEKLTNCVELDRPQVIVSLLRLAERGLIAWRDNSGERFILNFEGDSPEGWRQ